MSKVEYRYGPEYLCGFNKLDEETKDTYEFEASLCEKVIRTIGLKNGIWFPTCPKCNFMAFKVGHFVVNFLFPFTSGWRVVWMDEDVGDFVQCAQCGFKKPIKEEIEEEAAK